MKNTIQLVLSLTLISAFCAATLAYVDSITRAPIAAVQAEREQISVRAVLPRAVEKIERIAPEGAAATECYVGRNAEGAVAGYAAKGTTSKGYGGEIELMVGFESDGRTLVSYRKLAANETPGLGAKLATAEFTEQFQGKDGTGLKVKKEGGQIEAITAATITSRAVCDAIADAARKVAAVK